MKGKPQSSVKTVPEDWVTKWDQKPNCVPGLLKLCRSWVRAPRQVVLRE
jgi:hypothetical protein